MTSDPNYPGFGELGQRPQAPGEAAGGVPRLRPYQNTPAATPAPTPPPAPEQATNTYSAWHAAPPAEPFYPPAYPAAAHPAPGQNPPATPLNGYSNAGSTPMPPFTPPPVPSQDPFAAAASPATPPAADADSAISNGLHRAINAVRSTIPFVQRLLPLLEGNIATAATAITALVAPQPTVQHIHHPPAPAPPPAPVPVPVQVDLEPLEHGLTEVNRGLVDVRTAHRELRTQVAEQTTAIKRFEDQLEHVREATDRNTLEQQELVEDLRTVGSRLSTFAIIGLVLLVLSLLVNTFLIVQMEHILH